GERGLVNGGGGRRGLTDHTVKAMRGPRVVSRGPARRPGGTGGSAACVPARRGSARTIANAARPSNDLRRAGRSILPVHGPDRQADAGSGGAAGRHSFPGEKMKLTIRLAAVAAAGLLAAGCASAGPPSASPTASPTPSPPASAPAS